MKWRSAMITSTIRIVRLFIKKINEDHIAAFSAQAAFFIIISFFPFLMFLFSIIKFFPFEESQVMRAFTQIFPKSLNSLVISIIYEVNRKTSSTIISVTAITALWSAGKGFLSIMKGLNAVYEIKETRRYFYLRFTSAFYTLIFAVMIIASMVLFVFGNSLYLWIEHRIPSFRGMALLIISLRTIVGLITLSLFFMAIYMFIPNRKTTIMNELPGTLICAAGWMGFSYAFSFYIDHYSNYASMYGSLTTIVMFMLWLYFCMYILFIGAEINQSFKNKVFMTKIKRIYHQPSNEEIPNK